MLPPHADSLITLALAEDLPAGDLTSEAVLPPSHVSRARIEAREELVVCGLGLAEEVFRRVDPAIAVTRACTEGDRVDRGATVLDLYGPTAALLAAERTVLNFLQHLSGIATLARRFRDLAAGHQGWHGEPLRIVDTRKTIPGYRALEKYAVRVGGCSNHRLSLSEHVLIKDNHIAAAGSVAAAVALVRARAPHSARVEVEVQDLVQLEQALAADAEVIMLDNFTPDAVSAATRRIAGRALVEISGGITLENIGRYLPLRADVISVGALTHSARAVDLSLTILPP